jgi:hypothetical protein
MLYKEPNTQERRRLKRQNLSYFMQVLDPENLSVIGHLVDINRIGLMLDSNTPLIGGKEMRVRLDTTTEVADKACIEFRARIKWCRVDKIEPNVYNCGLEITSITSHDADIIQHIVDRYGMR